MPNQHKILEHINALMSGQEKGRSESRDRWYSVFNAIEDFQISGKLVSDRDGQIIAADWFHQLPVLVDGQVRRRYYRYYPGNPIESTIEQLEREGRLRESEAWKYKKKYLTKVLFLPTKVVKGTSRWLQPNRPTLIYFWGPGRHRSFLHSLKAMLTSGLSEEYLNLDTFFDPFVQESHRVEIVFTPGKDGTLLVHSSPAPYRPPERLPEELRDFSIHDLGIPTHPDWSPEESEYEEAVELFQEFLLRGNSAPGRLLKSKEETPNRDPEEESPPWEESIPAKGRVITSGEFVYELREDGKPTCFGQVDTNDRRCLNCDFLGECLSSS